MKSIPPPPLFVGSLKRFGNKWRKLGSCLSFVAMFSFIFGPQLRAGQYQPDGSGDPVWVTDVDENGDPVDVEPTEGADWGHNDPDMLPNWLEDYYGTDRYNPDSDGDGLTDRDEIYTTGTDPTVYDTDGNGTGDGEQWWAEQYPDTTDTTDSYDTSDSTDSNNTTDTSDSTDSSSTTETDADGDLLGESLEASIGTSDYQADSDGDGFSDYAEYMGWVEFNGNSYGISSHAAVFDSDADGIGDMDQWLTEHFPQDDYDGDYLTNADEVYSVGTRPTLWDTDGDGNPDSGGGDSTDSTDSTDGTDDSWRANDVDGDGVTAGDESDLVLNDNDAYSNGNGYHDWYYWYFNAVWNNGYDVDSDGDGVGALLEEHLGTSDELRDSDGNYVEDWYEYYVAVLASSDTTDADGDGLHAQLEAMLGTSDDPESGADSDQDGLDDAMEWANLSFSDPALGDTDGDGLVDGAELAAGTLARAVDTDGDHLTDNEEVNVFAELEFSPALKDTDGDGVPDYYEADEAGVLVDSDNGGIPDRLEEYWELDKNNPADDVGDIDGDDLTNLQEYNTGYDIWNGWTEVYDTDGDGMTDVWEVAHGLDPITPDGDQDPDGDWWFNIEEYWNATDPGTQDAAPPEDLSALNHGSLDWDNDGVWNYDELYVGSSNPRVNPNVVIVNPNDWDGDGYLNDDEVVAGTDPNDANSHPGKTGRWETQTLTVSEGDFKWGEEVYEELQNQGVTVTYTKEEVEHPVTFNFGADYSKQDGVTWKAAVEAALGETITSVVSVENQEEWMALTATPRKDWKEGQNPDAVDDFIARRLLEASNYNVQGWEFDGVEAVKSETVKIADSVRPDGAGRWRQSGYKIHYVIKVRIKKWVVD